MLSYCYDYSALQSHPTWVRGLKPQALLAKGVLRPSHPTWVRGLKPRLQGAIRKIQGVAPHVGAWIETWHFTRAKAGR